MKKTLLILIAFLCLCYSPTVFGQYQGRTYANFQGVYKSGLYVLGIETVMSSMSNAAQAADGDPQTASSLSIPVGLLGLTSVTQYLGFTTAGTLNTVRTIPAGTPVSVKLTMPQSVLGLAESIEIGVYSGLQAVSAYIDGGLIGTGVGHPAGHEATTTKKLESGASLLNLINAAGALEVQLTPDVSYEGVYVKLSGNALSVALTVDIYEAYIMENKVIPCSEQGNVVDVLSGIRGNALVNLLSATGTVLDPSNAVDRGPNSLNTYATLSTGVQVLGEVYQTVVFNTPSLPGDSLQVVIQDPSAGLLDLTLLGGLKIVPYYQDVAGAEITTALSLLSLQLLSPADNIYLLSIPISTSFDKVTIALGGVADVLSALRVYDVSRKIPKPSIVGLTGTRIEDTITITRGAALLMYTVIPETYNWYDAGGNMVNSGPVYPAPPITESTHFTITPVRYSCLVESSSYVLYVKVLDITLPVVDLTLKGQPESGAIKVQWLAKGEHEVSHYTLQKNTGSGFVDIATISAKENSVSSDYEFIDQSPLSGNNLYRVIVHDHSGDVHYSSTLLVLWNKAQVRNLRVFPNPASVREARFLDGLQAGEYKLEIVTSTGNLLRQSRIQIGESNTPVSFETGNLAAGVYWLVVTPLNGMNGSERMSRAFWIR